MQIDADIERLLNELAETEQQPRTFCMTSPPQGGSGLSSICIQDQQIEQIGHTLGKLWARKRRGMITVHDSKGERELTREEAKQELAGCSSPMLAMIRQTYCDFAADGDDPQGPNGIVELIDEVLHERAKLP